MSSPYDDVIGNTLLDERPTVSNKEGLVAAQTGAATQADDVDDIQECRTSVKRGAEALSAELPTSTQTTQPSAVDDLPMTQVVAKDTTTDDDDDNELSAVHRPSQRRRVSEAPLPAACITWEQRKIGAGGVGVVYEANLLCNGTEESLVMKFPKDDQHTAVHDHEREVLMYFANHRHPNVMYLHSEGTAAASKATAAWGRRFGKVLPLVMPRASGGELLKLMQTGGLRAEPGLSKQVATQAAMGVAHFHANCYAHLDISSENFLVHWVDGEPQVMLSDFGSARRCTPEGVFARPTNVAMKSQYCAPEWLDNKSHITQAADIFSLGVVLFAVFSGSAPFRDCRDPLYARVSNGELGYLVNQWKLNIPCQVVELLQAMLDSDPATRPTAQQVVNDLAAL